MAVDALPYDAYFLFIFAMSATVISFSPAGSRTTGNKIRTQLRELRSSYLNNRL